jgi:hypothetical protein
MEVPMALQAPVPALARTEMPESAGTRLVGRRLILARALWGSLLHSRLRSSSAVLPRLLLKSAPFV